MNHSKLSHSPVLKAVVPAAGLGSRLRPLTSAIPKEMLPLGRKFVLQYVIEELVDSGITDICIVVSPAKEMIKNFFGSGDAFGANIDYIVQSEMKGLGDAILLAEHWVAGEAFVTAFGDCIIEGTEVTPLSRLLQTFVNNSADAAVLTQFIPLDLSTKYGIIAPHSRVGDEESVRIVDIVEKPLSQNAPSNRAVAARWILNNKIFDSLRTAPLQKNGELNLTDAVSQLVRAGSLCWSTPLLTNERRIDIGGWRTYLTATIEYALKDNDYGREIRSEFEGATLE